MNLFRAEDYLRNYGNTNSRLSEFYDEDEMLANALTTLFPDFEYPDFSHRTIGEIQRMVKDNPRSPMSA